MDFKIKLLNLVKRFYTQELFHICNDYVQKSGQQANDFIYETLSEKLGCPV